MQTLCSSREVSAFCCNIFVNTPHITYEIYFKICFDTGHAAVFNELNPAEEIKRLGSEIRTLHIHNNKENRNLHLLPYFGIINWNSVVEALNEINFRGSFSLEVVPPRKLSNDLFEDISRLP